MVRITLEVLPLIGYFLLIFLLLFLIYPNFSSPSAKSTPSRIRLKWNFESSTFLLLALLSLGSTWTYMFKYFLRSFQDAAERAGSLQNEYTVKEWLASTSLFVEAWSQVCARPRAWWWSEQLCAFTAGAITCFWYLSSHRYGIKRSWAFMLLGQVVAISFAMNLFFLAITLAPRSTRRKEVTQTSPLLIWSTLLSLLTVVLVPSTMQKPTFLPNLLLMHVLLILPLLPRCSSAKKSEILKPSTLYFTYAFLSLLIRLQTYSTTPRTLIDPRVLYTWARHTLFSHPAQSSICFDIVFATVSFFTYITFQEKKKGCIGWIGVALLAMVTPWIGVQTSASLWLGFEARRRREEEEATVTNVEPVNVENKHDQIEQMMASKENGATVDEVPAPDTATPTKSIRQRHRRRISDQEVPAYPLDSDSEPELIVSSPYRRAELSKTRRRTGSEKA